LAKETAISDMTATIMMKSLRRRRLRPRLRPRRSLHNLERRAVALTDGVPVGVGTAAALEDTADGLEAELEGVAGQGASVRVRPSP
jgi:hypothetical protein